MAIRPGIDENDFTSLGGDQQDIAHEDELSVTVATTLPAPAAVCRVETGENAVVKACFPR